MSSNARALCLQRVIKVQLPTEHTIKHQEMILRPWLISVARALAHVLFAAVQSHGGFAFCAECDFTAVKPSLLIMSDEWICNHISNDKLYYISLLASVVIVCSMLDWAGGGPGENLMGPGPDWQSVVSGKCQRGCYKKTQRSQSCLHYIIWGSAQLAKRSPAPMLPDLVPRACKYDINCLTVQWVVYSGNPIGCIVQTVQEWDIKSCCHLTIHISSHWATDKKVLLGLHLPTPTGTINAHPPDIRPLQNPHSCQQHLHAPPQTCHSQLNGWTILPLGQLDLPVTPGLGLKVTWLVGRQLDISLQHSLQGVFLARYMYHPKSDLFGCQNRCLQGMMGVVVHAQTRLHPVVPHNMCL
ncbi:hypothetical protein XELAEV_18004832mg [Xenopus laevis]|uniref:Uncharacterized protein n=1 Tax=Xenopus laevis TaxID=8355 RepID=A0A974I226_XENLA|nr:hypothetical protein XELAEV_18004832mg [Xenopus laevis]